MKIKLAKEILKDLKSIMINDGYWTLEGLDAIRDSILEEYFETDIVAPEEEWMEVIDILEKHLFRNKNEPKEYIDWNVLKHEKLFKNLLK